MAELKKKSDCISSHRLTPLTSSNHRDCSRLKVLKTRHVSSIELSIDRKYQFLVGNLPRYDVYAARNVGLALEIAAEQRADEAERQNDESADAENR